MIIVADDLKPDDLVDLHPVLTRTRSPLLGYQPDAHLIYLTRMARLAPFRVVSKESYGDDRARVVRLGVNVDGGRDIEYFHLSVTEKVRIQTSVQKEAS